MRFYFFGQWLAVFFGLLFLAACGTPATNNASLQSCQYDFNVNVRSGTNSGMTLKGKLALQQDEKGAIIGLMKPTGETDATKFVKVDGKATGNEVTLNFKLTDGRTITGTGPFPSAPAKCDPSSTTITGQLTGPDKDDKGDWDAQYVAKFACAATCEFFNLSTTCDLYCSGTKLQTTK